MTDEEKLFGAKSKVIKYRLTSTGRSLVEVRRREASPSEEVLELLLENPEQTTEELAVQLNKEPEFIERIVDNHIKHGRVIGVLER